MSNQIIYRQVIEDLRMQIKTSYASEKEFCEKNKFGRHNLCRVFAGSQVMSLDLYIRICTSLSVLPPGSNLIKGHYSSMTLLDFISIQNDIVLSMFHVLLDVGELKNDRN